MDTIDIGVLSLFAWCYSQYAVIADYKIDAVSTVTHIQILRSHKEIEVDGRIILRGPYIGSKIKRQLYDLFGCENTTEYTYVDKMPSPNEFCKSWDLNEEQTRFVLIMIREFLNQDRYS